MAVAFRQFTVAAPPRAGTTWFLTACAVADMRAMGKASHIPFNGERNTVTLVRHPLDWLASIYYGLNCGVCQVPLIDMLSQEGKRETFAEFVRWYLGNEPGLVGRIFAIYRADTSLRVEDFPVAAVEFLRGHGASEDALGAVEKIPRINGWKSEPGTMFKRSPGLPLDEHLAREVMAAEAAYCDRHGYAGTPIWRGTRENLGRLQWQP